ncbi:MAG: T9SS type A sorting domain-containing protein [Bacteroidales bacterium]|nr:T9SS type A sorting domain-containing protein [Bacteroidales bacterium]
MSPSPEGIDNADEVKIELYPNSTNGPLNINSSETISRVEVYNIYGQQVRNVETGSTSVQLNLSELVAGTYILNIHTSSGVTHKRITVK